jgi:DNA repair exonuclease SbcCD ATPase subunit
MDKKYLPSLKKIQIKNFSLYPGDLDFTYDFIEGVNLIIGGNGVGKTTFLNIIKYALIGLYKKGTDVKRREYKGIEYRYEKRVNLPYKFFFNRMDSSVDYNEKAEVILTFFVNEKYFEITRDLFSPMVKKVVLKESDKITTLNGKIISQYDFDILFSDRDKNVNALKETLQWQYEEALGYASGHDSFDNIIVLVNDVLFFSEQRETIMWDGPFQSKFSSIYFIEPSLLKELEKCQLDGKYYDSLSRHKSEDIRAINKIFEKIKDSDSKNREYKDLIVSIEKLKKEVESNYKQLEKIQNERGHTEVSISKLHTEKNQLNKNLEDLENRKRAEEQIIFIDLFKKVTPKYYDYLKYLKSSGDCPLCNNVLPDSLFEKIRTDDSHCMMCGNSIKNPMLSSSKLTELKNQITEAWQNIRKKEKDIITENEALKKLDSRFKETNLNLNEAQSDLRKVEFAVQRFQNDNNSKTDSEFKAMKAQIDELDKEKEEAQKRSKAAFKQADVIVDRIDRQRLDSTQKLSDIFNKFGNKFLGVSCELVYEDPKDDEGKRYLPRINGIDRYHEEELSESQRFFIDQSFRMSLLNFFNSSSSFFMCETPDSSLDISYEKNAAKVYLEYIKQPNELILTSNLNNSEFLEYLIEEAKDINYINLLKIGKKSAIQSDSTELLGASSKIENIINGKRNNR